jgi:hypothetical protein
VFTHLTGIEELYVTFPRSVDDVLNADLILCGLSAGDAARLWLQHRGNLGNANMSSWPSSITSLSRLRKLVVVNGSRHLSLTDLSVHFAFLRMAGLVELDVGWIVMSPACVTLLRDKLVFTFLVNAYPLFPRGDLESDGFISGTTHQDVDPPNVGMT